MKLSVNRKIHYESGPDMTPLVDVVMVLLIFLMMVGTFLGAEHYLVSNLPLRESGSGQSQPPPGGFPLDEPLEIRVDLNATRDGFIARAGRIEAGGVDALAGSLAAMRRQFEESGTPASRVQVIISPSRDVRLQHVVDVFQAAQLAEFTKIGFASAR